MHLPTPLLSLRWLVTLAIASAGGFAANRIGAPLPWLLGGMLTMASINLSGVHLGRFAPALPAAGRVVCVPIIGVLIGSAFSPVLFQAALGWWRPMLAVVVFAPVVHFACYLVLRHLGRLDRATAFFGSMPGGLVEALDMGEKAGGEIRRLTVLHSSRIAVTITAVPLIFSLIRGEPVGSAAGEVLGRGVDMGFVDAILLAACAWAGYKGARRIGLPAAQLLGPLILSAAVHGIGLTDAAPPGWLVATAQLVIGTSLGVRLSGLDGPELRRMIGLGAICVAITLTIGVIFAVVVSGMGISRVSTMVLSLAPGGVVEMGLVALSLQASPIFITAMHMTRLFLTVLTSSAIWRVMAARG